MTEICVNPSQLEVLRTDIGRVASDLRNTSRRMDRAMGSLELVSNTRTNVDQQAQDAVRLATNLAEKAEQLARFAQLSARLFYELDQKASEIVGVSVVPFQQGLQDRLEAAKRAWHEAQGREDKEGADAAHAEAEHLRSIGAQDTPAMNQRIQSEFESQQPSEQAPPLSSIFIDPAALRAAQTPTEKLALLRPVFEAAERETGVPWQVTAAQWALETRSGERLPVDINTGKESYNLFGVKGEGPAGSVESWTKEHISGQDVEVRDTFRAYNTYVESVADRGRLFTSMKRYAPAIACGGDLKCWTEQLQACGYATDPDYSNKLWSIITANKWNT